MKPFQVRSKKLSGTRWAEVSKEALNLYKQITSRTKRRPYVKSAYFKRDKIFLTLFWGHLHEKQSLKDKTRRLKYFPCGIELIKESTLEPTSKENPNNVNEIVHRFAGLTADNELFFVQIKEVKRTGAKWLMSIFPLDK